MSLYSTRALIYKNFCGYEVHCTDEYIKKMIFSKSPPLRYMSSILIYFLKPFNQMLCFVRKKPNYGMFKISETVYKIFVHIFTY